MSRTSSKQTIYEVRSNQQVNVWCYEIEMGVTVYSGVTRIIGNIVVYFHILLLFR